MQEKARIAVLVSGGGTNLQALIDAEKQGIKKGDIIIKVNGKDARTTSDVADVKAELSIGDTIGFTIWRDGSTFDLDVKLMDSADIFISK